MTEVEPHLFDSIGQPSGTFGLQSLMCQLYHMRNDLDFHLPDNLAEYGMYEILQLPGLSNFIPALPSSIQSDASISRTLFHERYHYWQLISSPAMIIGHWAHLRLIEERIITNRGDSKHLLTAHSIFQGKALSDSSESNRPLLARMMALMTLQNAPIDEFQSRYHLTASEWLRLLIYLKWITNHTTVEFVKSPKDYFVRLALDESTMVAMSRTTNLLDVIIQYVPSKKQYVVVPISATTLLESAAYVAENLFSGRLPKFPKESEMNVDWYLYYEPWMTWQLVYGDLFEDPLTAAHAFIATVDLMLCTDWLGQVSYYDDSDLRDEMISPSYRFTAFVRAHRHVRGELRDFAKSKKIDWAEYQNRVSEIMGWPSPQKVVRRLFEFVVVLDAIIYDAFDKLDGKDISRFVDPNLPESTDDEILELYDHLNQIRTVIGGGAVLVFGQRLLETMTHALHARYMHPRVWADTISNYDILGTFFQLPVMWVNDQPFSEGISQPINDLMRYVSIHGMSALTGIDDSALVHLSTLMQQGDPPMRFGFDNVRNPIRCGIEQYDVPCDHMTVGFICPFHAKTTDKNVATQCYYVDTLQRLRLESYVPSDIKQSHTEPKEEKMNIFRKLFGNKQAKKPKVGHIIQLGGAVYLTDDKGAQAIHEREKIARKGVNETILNCPFCGEQMKPSLTGLSLQCGERSIQRHPVIMWDPADETFSTYSSEVASTLKAKGWKIEKAGSFLYLKPPKK